MVKVLRKIFILGIFIVVFLSCTPKNFTDTSQISTDVLVLCGSYGVPGMFCMDFRGGTYSCEILEMDSEGRALFSYSTKNIITGEWESVLAICQKYDSQYVYFYEDLCYLRGAYQDHDVEQLKILNDWECPLNFDKMSRRKNKISFDRVVIPESLLDSKRIYSVCCEVLKVSTTQIKTLRMLDEDLNGHELYWFELDMEGNLETYFLIINSNYQIKTMIANPEDINVSELVQFKQQNGWVYGFTD